MSSGDVIAARLRLDGQSQFNAGAQKASKSVAGIGKSAEESSKQSGKATGATASGLLAAAAAAGVTYKAYGWIKGSISETVDLAKSTASLSRVTGLDSKQAQAWSLIAKERGIQSKQLQMGMATLGRNIGGLGGPTAASDKALAKLGLSSAELMALPMNIRMGMIADSFKALPNGVEKAALAQKLFGRSGLQLLPILNQGSQAINKQMDEANKLVPPLGKSGTAALNLAKKQRELGMASTGLKVAVGSALIPILSTLATAVTPLIQDFASLMASCKPLTYVIIGLTAAIAGLLIMNQVKAAMDALRISTIAKTVADKAGAVATKMWAAAQWLFNAALAANPIALVVIAIVALVAALVAAYFKVTWFHNAVNAMAQGVVAGFNWVKNAGISVFNWIKGNWPLLLGILTGPFGAAAALIITHFDKIKGAATSVVNAVKSTFAKVPGIIKGMFSGAVGLAGDLGRGIANWLNANTPFGDNVSVGPVHFRIPALAAGGTMLNAGPALVGEKGPELVSLPAGATVTPLSGSPAMAANITVPVYLDRRQIALATGSWFSDQAARQGKAQ
jgi:phage-related protein